MGISLIGAIIEGRYRIESCLGEGGSGAVYKAYQIDFNRYVAIKALHATDWRDPEVLARFEREAKILGKLSQNIVGVYTSIIYPDAPPYLVLEYVEGMPLSTVLQNGGVLSEPRSIDIAMQISKALEVAHAEGIIHRDLKPQNVMLTVLPRPDFVKVLDFGLSRLIQADESAAQRLTRTGELIGTPQYMSPEQCTGEPIDARSDIYALGCIMYECVSGRPPFNPDNPLALLYKHRHEWPERLTKIESCSASPELELVVFEMSQKDPAERFQSAQELCNALRLLSSGNSDQIKLGDVSFGTKQKKRSPAGIIVTSLILLLVIAGTVFFKTRSAQMQKDLSDNGSTNKRAAERLTGSPERQLVALCSIIGSPSPKQLEEIDSIIPSFKNRPELLRLAYLRKATFETEQGETAASIASLKAALKGRTSWKSHL